MLFRRLIASLLLFVLIVQSCDRLLIVADFYANQDIIAKTLCENKDRPTMRCCGKCVLRKKLAQQERNNKDDREKKGEVNVDVVSSRSWFPAIDFTHFYILSHYCEFQPGQIADRAAELLRPPCLA